MADLKSHVARAVRFGLVGALNSVVGLGVIYGLDLGLHVAPELANAAGYAVGVTVSFTLSKTFVFRSKERVGATGPRYLMVILAAFLLNQAVLRVALALLGKGTLQHAAAQLSGMACYTAFSFLACQFWVFKSRPSAPETTSKP